MPPHFRCSLVCALLLSLATSALAAPPPFSAASGLPPGLQKKVSPGQQAGSQHWTLERPPREGDHLPDYLYRGSQVLNLDDRHQRVAVEDRVYIVLRETLEILRVMDL
ncbi:MAG: hypothetical protein MI794_15210 [Pseudomonadales bacterium]|nr:hypothetical protein [Pseudomonadales bacterium]